MKIPRPLIQSMAALLTNININGFIQGTIFKGGTKAVCVPGLNCYSCPGAVGSCPIGSVQAVIGGRKHNIAFYVFGLITLFGILLGRLICGFLCLFGFVQDLLYKIPVPKFDLPKRLDRGLRYLKYIMLLGLVILLPLLIVDTFGLGTPYFCKYVCPAGILEGAIPLILTNPGMRDTLGVLFTVKLITLIAVLLLSMFTYRPFCKYVCPLGAFYGLFNKVSLYRMNVEKSACIDCGRCERACHMKVPVRENINSAECIRCGACKKACPTKCITSSFGFALPQSTTKEVAEPSVKS